MGGFCDKIHPKEEGRTGYAHLGNSDLRGPLLLLIRTPCPAAGLIFCPTCKDLKPTVCRKASCKAAQGPLLLTMQPPALTHTLPTIEEGV